MPGAGENTEAKLFDFWMRTGSLLFYDPANQKRERSDMPRFFRVDSRPPPPGARVTAGLPLASSTAYAPFTVRGSER